MDDYSDRYDEPPPTASDGKPAVCGTCRWWWCWEDDGSLGDCRRYPPVLRPPDGCADGEAFDQWVTTEPQQWCGEWVPASGRSGSR